MSFLLDTSVISEWVKPLPHPGVIRWLANADEDRVYISVIAIAEVRGGLERMPRGRRRDRIAAWLSEDLVVRFEGRIVPVDIAIAQEWGVVVGEARVRGMNIAIMDAFLVASARVRGMVVVTRNTRDFRGLGVEVVDPWE